MPMCLCKQPITREESWPHHCARCHGIPWPKDEAAERKQDCEDNYLIVHAATGDHPDCTCGQH